MYSEIKSERKKVFVKGVSDKELSRIYEEVKNRKKKR